MARTRQKDVVTNLDVFADAVDQGTGVIVFHASGPLSLGMLRKALAAIPSRFDVVEVFTADSLGIGPCSGFELTSAEDLPLALILNRWR